MTTVTIVYRLKCGNCDFVATSTDEDRTKAMIVDHQQAVHVTPEAE